MYQNYHALKLSSLKNKLEQIPKIYIGKDLIFVYSNGKRNRFRPGSPNGKKWYQISLKTNELKKEYDHLKREWVRKYKIDPPDIYLPIIGQERMNTAYYDSKEPCKNDKPIKHPTYYNDIAFRSKNEQMTAMVLEEMGIEYKYETELKISDFLTIHPDFLIHSREADRCIYLEVFGAPDDPEYKDQIQNRLKPYITAGLRLGVDVVMIYAPTSHSFDVEDLRRQIDLIMESITPVFVE